MQHDRTAPITVHYAGGIVCLTGAVEQRLRISAENMLHVLAEHTDARAIDLLGIAAGVYVIDRVVKRTEDESNECGVRVLSASFAVSDLAFWSQPNIAGQLTDVLAFLTGDAWLISFIQAPNPRSASSPQRALLDGPRPTRIGLYSGGLDSAAGFANRLLGSRETFLLLTVGHQSSIRLNCAQQFKWLRSRPEFSSFFDTSFKALLESGAAGKMGAQETTQRARGFLFCAAAGLVANACGVEEVELFENGVGAVNLPLTEGGLIDGLSTRGANPGFLAKMSRLLSSVFDKRISFHLPFLGSTKAEMVANLAHIPGMHDWLTHSRSCVHSSLRVAKKRHCGVCPACIERRQSFKVGGIHDTDADYERNIFDGAVADDPAYFLSYLENARWWTERHPRVSTRLHRHRILSSIEHIPEAFLAENARRHALEVQNVYGRIALILTQSRAEPVIAEAQLEFS